VEGEEVVEEEEVMEEEEVDYKYGKNCFIIIFSEKLIFSNLYLY
jgi:hypothetical protein